MRRQQALPIAWRLGSNGCCVQIRHQAQHLIEGLGGSLPKGPVMADKTLKRRNSFCRCALGTDPANRIAPTAARLTAG